MHKITFHCETITPMFLSGADGQTPELRAPSIKGALRFWWRAVNGHLVTDKNGGVENLLKEDEKLWGGTSTINKGKSPVRIKVLNRSKKLIYCNDLKRYAEHDPRDRRIPYRKQGLAYLYYVLLNQKCNDLEGLDTGSCFSVTISSKDKDKLINVILSFWIFTTFGSLGTRARRGAGAFTIKKIEDYDSIISSDLDFIYKGDDNYSIFLQQNLKKVKEKFNPNNSSVSSKSYSQVEDIFFSKHSFKTWQEALDDIGNIMRKLRTSNKNVKYTVYDIPKKAAFGLPIGIRQDNSATFKVNQRLASPIYISLIKATNRKFHWVVTHLKGSFKEANDKIIFESKNRNMSNKKKEVGKKGWDDIDPALLNSFIKIIKPISNPITY